MVRSLDTQGEAVKEPSAATRQDSTLEDTDEFLDLLGEHAAREEQTKRRRVWLVAAAGLVYTLLCGWLAGPWLTLLLVGTPLMITGLVLWFRRSSGLGVVPRRISGPLVILGIVMLAAGTFLALRPGSSPAFASPDPKAPAIVPQATPGPLAPPPPPPPEEPAPPATPEPELPPADEAPVEDAPVEEAPVEGAPVDPAPPVQEPPAPPPVENPAPPPPVENPAPPPEEPPPVEEPPVDEPPIEEPPVEEPPPEVPDPGMSQPVDPIPPTEPTPDVGIL